jgi:GWxTD domain-containing protein
MFFKIRTNELFYRPDITTNAEKCSFTLKYLLQEIGDETNIIVDSNTYIYEFNKENLNKYYITQIPIKALDGNSYRVKVTVRDNFRKSFSVSYLNVEKKRELGEQYFNISSIGGTPLFRNVLINDGVFRINHSSPASDKLFISYFNNDTPAPKPIIASSSDEFLYRKRDSLYVVDFSPNSALSLHHSGLYYIQFDTSSKEGVTVLKINNDFPKIEEPDGLIPPLVYITTDAEFNKLIKENNPKLTADRFWINAGGNIEKGREMIRLYYNRVYFANYYFTSTKPGWKTDRGMVYIVYGPPHEIKKSAFKETWIYKSKRDSEKIKFDFNYTPNQYNINNFTLSRSNNHTWRWTEAVYAWTSGDIFLYD